MKIHFWSVGKVHESYIKEGTELFTKRIGHYYPVQWNIIPSVKNAAALSPRDVKQKEAEQVMAILKKDDYLVLLDERGRQLGSESFSAFIAERANESIKNLVFLIGGAFGVHEMLLNRADFTWSLSQLVFPHQMVRLILAEQVYRACTIIRNEKYHHT